KDKYAYLACGFGIVVVDLAREEIHDTYKIGPEGSLINVYDFTYHPEDNRFYAATESGIYSADADSPNLAHYIYWNKDTTLTNPGAVYNEMASHGEYVVTNKHGDEYDNDTILYKDGSNWMKLETEENRNNTNASSIRSTGEKLLISHTGAARFFDDELNFTGNIYTYSDDTERPNPSDCWQDADGIYWVADERQGLVKTQGNYGSEFITPSGPAYPSAFDMASFEDDLWVASGGYQSAWNPSGLNHGVYAYLNGNWQSFNRRNTQAFDTIRDVVTVAIEPGTGEHIYMGSWTQGLLEFTKDGIQQVYDKTNSTLQGNLAAPGYVQVSGLGFDDENNLWVANSGVNDVLSVKKANGEWKAFNLGSQSAGSFIGEMIVDENNQKWILTRGHEIFVFDENNTIDQTSDDNVRILTSAQGNGNLPGSQSIYSIAEDLDGNIWVGTDEGVGVFYNPGAVSEGQPVNAEKPKVEVEGYVQYLLSSEKVTSIVVDGANRKWFGTQRAGVFLMSEDGTEQLKHFNMENSPLFSNEINTMSITDNGMVFMGTSKGIISYKSDATPAPPTNDIFIYPNPVTKGYEGQIYIENLVKDANVKITDISGDIVYETTAKGGLATWNGADFNGEKVNSGYYLVFASNEDGSESIVSKILVIDQ
ncbi:MAG: T9SS type A sorting domain-containing protein, partial [Bacteroidales bacterium]|nr:T9SS type A sorting domain-containing protein [Bacteroidales bacterium]